MARNKLATLQFPKDRGGLAVPHSQMYYFAAQLHQFTEWDRVDMLYSRDLLLGSDTGYSVFSHMEMGLPEVPSHCPTVQLLMKLWKSVKHTLGLTGFLHQMPIWRNCIYRDLAKVVRHPVWKRAGIRHIAQILTNSVMKPYVQLS